jgi:hypothetical protein
MAKLSPSDSYRCKSPHVDCSKLVHIIPKPLTVSTRCFRTVSEIDALLLEARSTSLWRCDPYLYQLVVLMYGLKSVKTIQ